MTNTNGARIVKTGQKILNDLEKFRLKICITKTLETTEDSFVEDIQQRDR